MHRKYSTLGQRKNIFELVWVCMTCIMLAIMAFLLSVNLVAMDESLSSLSGLLGVVDAQALLQKAIQEGSLIDVTKAIQAGAKLNQQDDNKRTVIGAGVYYGRKDIIDYLRWRYSEFLPKAGKCLLDAVKSFPSTDEIKSAKGLQRRLAILDLVTGDAQEELAGKLGGRALRATLRKRNPDFRILEILLRHGANPNDSSCPKKAPLYKALEQDEKLARVLIEHKAQVQTMMHVLTPKQLRNLQNILKERAAQVNHEQLSAFIGLDTVLFPYWSMGHRAQLLARLNFKQLAALALISPEYCALVQKHTHAFIDARELNIHPLFNDPNVLRYYKHDKRELNWLDVIAIYRSLLPSVKTFRIIPNLLVYLEEDAELEKLKGLRVLSLACIPFDERRVLERISMLSQLEELDLSHTGLSTPEDAEYVGKIKGLVRLHFAGNTLTNKMIVHFATLQNLRGLNVADCKLDSDAIEAIGVFLPHLTSLHVENNNLGFEGTLALLKIIKASMPGLKCLAINTNNIFKSCDGGALLPRNTETYRKLILEALAELGNLEELHVDNNDLGFGETLSLLDSVKRNMPNLKRLGIANNCIFNPREGAAISPRSTEISRKFKVLQALKELKSLRELCISEDNLSYDDMKSFRQELPDVTITRAYKENVDFDSIESKSVHVYQK